MLVAAGNPANSGQKNQLIHDALEVILVTYFEHPGEFTFS